LSTSGFAAGPAAQQDVDRAIKAIGGPATSEVRTIVVKGQTRHLEPEQSFKADGEYRLADNSTFTQSRDLVAGKSRTDWYRKMVYPAPREYKYAEIVAGGIGFVDGVDSTGRVKQSLEMNQHAMSGLRVAAASRELERTSPLLVVEMQKNPARLAKLADQKVGSEALPAVSYRGERNTFIVMFDRSTGVPVRVRTLDYDSIQGDSTYDLVLSDWREVSTSSGPIKYPFKQVYQLNGGDVIETTITDVAVNQAVGAEAFNIPQSIRASAPKIATNDIPYQWVIRRQFIGTYLDSDAIAYDPQAGPGLRLVDLAPGVTQVVGGSHNSLIVEMDKYLVGFDAPISERQSKWTIEQAAKKYPGKPFKYVVLTHHHIDHSGGVRAYAAEGATIVVGKGDGAFFRKVLSAPQGLNPYGVKSVAPKVIEVDGKWSVTEGGRAIEAYLIESPHAAGYLIPYVPDAKMGFVTDIWGPGAPVNNVNPAQVALVREVAKAGITPEKFAGGHGSVGNYSDLTQAVQRQGAR